MVLWEVVLVTLVAATVVASSEVPAEHSSDTAEILISDTDLVKNEMPSPAITSNLKFKTDTSDIQRKLLHRSNKDLCNNANGIRIGGQCLVFENDHKTWQDAVESCEAKGQQLAIPLDPAALKAYHTNNFGYWESFWLGGSDSANEGTWVWNNGRAIENFPWEEPNPDNDLKYGAPGGYGQDCLAVGWKHGYDDKACTKENQYICELNELKTCTTNTTTDTTTTTEPSSAACPTGFFEVPNSEKQCFKYFNETALSWDAAKSKCQGEKLLLAKPADPISLRRYLATTEFGNKQAWIGARGTGTDVKWYLDGTTISSGSSLWYPGQINGKTSSTWCVVLAAHKNNLISYPNNPYFMWKCSETMYPLCEKLMN